MAVYRRYSCYVKTREEKQTGNRKRMKKQDQEENRKYPEVVQKVKKKEEGKKVKLVKDKNSICRQKKRKKWERGKERYMKGL